MIRTAAIAAAAVALTGGTAMAQPGRQRTIHDRLAHEATTPPVVEVFTMGPGDRRVERFGHAALCVSWPQLPEAERALCYNYGTTDFGQPAAMLWGFIRGDAEFWVETWPKDEMLDYYLRRDRSIWVQRLDSSVLPAASLLAMARKLATDARIENRYYRYHHFHDNCTTRVRDIVDRAFGGRLRAVAGDGPGPTFRDFGYAGFADDGWLLAIMDLAIGRSADARPSGWQAMFLPRYLRAAIAELGVEPVAVYRRTGPPIGTDPSSARWWSLLLALLIGLPAVVTRGLRRRQRTGLAVSAGLLGAIGLLLWLAAIVSPMVELRYNEALLLFVPTDLALLWLRGRRRIAYGRVRMLMVVAVSLLAAVGIFRQPLWLPILMVVPTLLVAATPAAAPVDDRALTPEPADG